MRHWIGRTEKMEEKRLAINQSTTDQAIVFRYFIEFFINLFTSATPISSGFTTIVMLRKT